MTKFYRSKIEYILTEDELERLINDQAYLKGDTLDDKRKTLVESSRRSKEMEYFKVIEISIEPVNEKEAKEYEEQLKSTYLT